MASSTLPFAHLTDSEIQEVRNLEKRLSTAHPGNETILLAYSK